MNDTIKAWAQLLTILTVIVVLILYGYPKYKRYLAIEAVQTEIDIVNMMSNVPAEEDALSKAKGRLNNAHKRIIGTPGR